MSPVGPIQLRMLCGSAALKPAHDSHRGQGPLTQPGHERRTTEGLSFLLLAYIIGHQAQLPIPSVGHPKGSSVSHKPTAQSGWQGHRQFCAPVNDRITASQTGLGQKGP